MSITRLALSSDATWQRAWVCDTTAERVTLLATWTSPLGPKRGDMILDNQTGQLYLVTNSGADAQITGLTPNPVDLNSDVVNVLPTANGGTSVDIASAALPLGSGQITFPGTQNPSGNVNTLDDYEEGTWTPTDLSGAALSFTISDAAYIKIGKFVIANASITWPVTASAQPVVVGGLPFTSATGSVDTWGLMFAFTNSGLDFCGRVNTNSTQFVISLTDGSTVINSQMSGTILRVNVLYKSLN